MQLILTHRTVYRYQESVKYTAQTLRLTPRRDGGQRILSWSIHAPGRRTEQIDAHGNVTHLLTLEEPHREIAIVVSGAVEIVHTEEVMRHEETLSPLAYLSPTVLTAPSEQIVALARQHLAGGGPLRRRLYDLAKGVFSQVRYRPGTTSVDDPAGAALERGEGVCQDQAHVLIACCRAAGVPARYVSGYLCSVAGSSGESASHAWVEVWLDDEKGWHGIDVTHIEPAGAGHCRLAIGRDYLDAAPVRGVRRGGGREEMDVSVTARAGGSQ
jgi:transglutaminase-like putative cysteine protease